MLEHDNAKAIEQGAAELHRRLSAKGDAPADTEIAIAIGYTDGQDVFAYYLVSLSLQKVFWFEKVPVTHVTGNTRAVVSQKHLGQSSIHGCLALADVSMTELAVRAEFW